MLCGENKEEKKNKGQRKKRKEKIKRYQRLNPDEANAVVRSFSCPISLSEDEEKPWLMGTRCDQKSPDGI